MEVYYRREIQHNYLIIEPDECQGWSYEVKMLLHNPIEGLLKFRMKLVDGDQQFFYEITSKQPLSRVLENRNITAEEIRKLVMALTSMLNKIEPFLLMPHQILLQAEYIYLEPEDFQLYFCLIPGRKADFSKELQELLYYLLKKVDHQNQESVVLAYGLYQETQKENYGIGNLMKFLNMNSVGNMGAVETQENLYQQEKQEIPEYNCDTYEEGNFDLSETEQEGVHIQADEERQRSRSVWMIAWMGMACGIGGIYLWKGSEFLWHRKEILLGILGVFLLANAITGYLDNQKQQKIMRRTDNERIKEEIKGGVRRETKEETKRETKGEARRVGQEFIKKKNASKDIVKIDDTKDTKIEVKKGKMIKRNGVKIDSENKNNQNNEKKITGNEKKIIRNEKKNAIKEEKWQILFQEEPEKVHKMDENVLQTTVLPMVRKTEEGHYLMSLQDGYENIVLNYFPFIIGKAEHMADYVIPKSSISRMHAKIERTEKGYQITDLNSTNGTWVGEHQLEANETFPLKINDKIRLSDLFFCFK